MPTHKNWENSGWNRKTVPTVKLATVAPPGTYSHGSTAHTRTSGSTQAMASARHAGTPHFEDTQRIPDSALKRRKNWKTGTLDSGKARARNTQANKPTTMPGTSRARTQIQTLCPVLHAPGLNGSPARSAGTQAGARHEVSGLARTSQPKLPTWLV